MPVSSVGITGSGLPGLALSRLVFGLMSALLHREGRCREKEREAIWIPQPRAPFKADHLCYTKRSLILLMKKQMHNDQTKQIRGHNESRRGEKIRREEESGEGGAGPGRGPQGRLAMSLSGGGPTGLGLPSLAFPSNIMTLVWKW